MSKWVKVEKQLPEDQARVIAWLNDSLELAWFSKGKWHRYDGTFFLTEKTRLDGVTHWLPIDWMTSKEWPKHGPKLSHKLRYHWQRVTDRASDVAHDLRPKGWGSKAQLSRKVTFYKDSSGRILTGMPENIPTPRGLERIVCGSALEAEKYSAMQRQQERIEHRRQQESRGAIEASFQAEIRSEMTTKMLNARDNKNREFMRRALEINAGRRDPTAYERESYLHSEGYEQGR